jgi:hypothetical protein
MSYYHLYDEDWVFATIKTNLVKELFQSIIDRYKILEEHSYSVEWFIEYLKDVWFEAENIVADRIYF